MIILVSVLVLSGSVVNPASLDRPDATSARIEPRHQPAEPRPGDGGLQRSDFNGDGYSDLAVRATRPISGDRLEGVVLVLYGSPEGLTSRHVQNWSRSDFGSLLRAGESDERGELFSFGEALAPGNFDGDRFADLAIGDTSVGNEAGAVAVLYGSAAGLTTDDARVFSLDTPGVRGAAEDSDRFGSAVVAANFGKGHYDDLAIGVPGKVLDAGEHGQGIVVVLYGGSAGLSTAGSQTWSKDSPGVPGEAADDGGFSGDALAAGNFSRSGFADLAIGAAGNSVDGVVPGGTVTVLRGSTEGLTARRSQRWSQASPGIAGQPNDRDFFGSSLAVGRFTGHDTMDLAVGVPGESVAGHDEAGAVNLIPGSPTGLTAHGSRLLTQDSEGVPDRSEEADHFGDALAGGNFGRDGRGSYDDLAIGSPGESIGSATGAGSVTVIYGGLKGLDTATSQSFHQDTPGIQDRAEEDDSFGQRLAAGHYGGPNSSTTAADLVVASAESIAEDDMAGALCVLRGGLHGLTVGENQLWRPHDLGHTDYIWFGEAIAS